MKKTQYQRGCLSYRGSHSYFIHLVKYYSRYWEIIIGGHLVCLQEGYVLVRKPLEETKIMKQKKYYKRDIAKCVRSQRLSLQVSLKASQRRWLLS